jgi:hypothetical protein
MEIGKGIFKKNCHFVMSYRPNPPFCAFARLFFAKTVHFVTFSAHGTGFELCTSTFGIKIWHPKKN